jgi:primosomal protein N'
VRAKGTTTVTCSNCESFDIAMDSMERLECNDCGNQKKPTRWDASYL